MSYSKPRQQSPAVKYIEWSGSEGKFFYYDKDIQEKVFMELPIYFIVLDELTTVKGYHEKSGSGIVSNEIRNTKTDKLYVRSWRPGISEKGLWMDIKDAVTNAGGKYCKSVYALLLTSKGEEIVNFQFHGSSFGGASQDKGVRSGWINAKFSKEQYGVQVKEVENGKKGSTEYICPIFDKVNIKPIHHEKALQADLELQKYLDYYFLKPYGNVEEEQITEDEVQEPYDHTQYMPQPKENDEPITDDITNIDDLPF